MYVNNNRAQILESLVKSRGWGPQEKTLANGVLQLLSDRNAVYKRMRMAVLASESADGGSASDAIQDMLAILDPEDDLFNGVSEAQVEKLRATLE